MVYYGFRYYSPSLGRWISRDPIEEIGGKNLYQFALNRALDLVDPDGRMLVDFIIAVSAEYSGKVAELGSKVSYVQRVRTAVKNMENLQMFIAGIHEADDNAFVDLITHINQLQGLAAEGFRGPRSLERRSHHLAPKAKELGQFFAAADIDPDDFMKEIPKWKHECLT